MESHLQNPPQAIQAQSHVLRNEQLTANIPEVYEPHVGRTIQTLQEERSPQHQENIPKLYG